MDRKIIRNVWRREPGERIERATILRHDVHPEGLDVERLRFVEPASFVPGEDAGHIVSVLTGTGRLRAADGDGRPLALGAGVHLYLPAGLASSIEAEAGTELLRVSAPGLAQARGRRLLLRDETFLSACAAGPTSLRWILTPQYLSRRVFLHHDEILLSRSGDPVSWFRTTMFDVSGLPPNQEGEPVFKMSYNSRTEFNVCYDVAGRARVRMAFHPYHPSEQRWGPWFGLDGDSTYHLDEAAGGEEPLRNKHEVHIVGGHVTLFCLFDPAPTGIERHRPGEYSDYEPLSNILGTELYASFAREIARYDDMVDRLSMAKARGELEALEGTPAWELYRQGRQAQLAIERRLAETLRAAGDGRDRVIARWMQSG
jgi:hypothetical protein